MKKTTIRSRLIKNTIAITLSMAILIIITSNVVINIYFRNTISSRLTAVIERTTNMFQEDGANLFPFNEPPMDNGELPPLGDVNALELNDNFSVPYDEQITFMTRLDHLLKDSLSVINANYILLDQDLNILNTYQYDMLDTLQQEHNKIRDIFVNSKDVDDTELEFYYNSIPYIGVYHTLEVDDNTDLSYIIMYSSMKDIETLRFTINSIIIIIVSLTLIVSIIISIVSAKRISEPFSKMNEHLHTLADRDFNKQLMLPTDDELSDFVRNINYLTTQLNDYTEHQKRFFENASHDLRSPLMAIRANAEGILYDVTNPKDSSQVIIDESLRMEGIVEDILYLSNLDRNQQIPFETFDVIELIHKLINGQQQLTNEKNVTIELNIPYDNLELYANYDQLLRCFENIYNNALEYTHSKVIINLSLVESIKDEASSDIEKLNILFIDDGDGIHPEDLNHIFDRFYKGKNGHHGLGLAIAKEIIEHHKGTIQAYNNSKGACFEINIPRSLHTLT